jgi:tRNA (guanine-N7-)-methyltransferase
MTAHKEGDPTTLNRLYGRSKGKPLRAGQQGLVDTLLPQIAVPLEGEVTAQRLFEDRPLHFEIGFGGGEHMAFRADMLPDHGFIGAEPFINGVAQALTHLSGDNGAHAPIRTCASITATRWRCSRAFPMVRSRCSICCIPIHGPRRAMPSVA